MPPYKVIAYRLGNERTGEWVDKDYDLHELLDAVKNRVEGHAPLILGQIGKPNQDSNPRPIPPSLDSLERFLKKCEVGATATVVGSGGMELHVRKIRTRLDLKDLPSANSKVDRCYSVVKVEFPNMGNYGWVSCRDIGGTSTPSQHTNWAGRDPGANAIDFAGTKSEMDDLADFLVRNARELDVNCVIWNRRIWTKEQGWHAYTGENPHTDHVHVDFNPSQSGATRC